MSSSSGNKNVSGNNATIRYRQKSYKDLTEAYKKWIKRDNGLLIKWLEKYVLKLISLLPENETLNDAMSFWKNYRTRYSQKVGKSDITKEDLKFMLSDFGIVFTERGKKIKKADGNEDPRKSKGRAFKKYGKNMSALIKDLHDIDTDIFSTELHSGIEENISEVSDAVAGNLLNDIEELKRALDQAFERIEVCDTAVKNSSINIQELVKKINNTKNLNEAKPLLKQVLTQTKNIASKCSKEETFELLRTLFDDLEDNIEFVSSVIPDAIISEVETDVEQIITAPPKAPPLPSPLDATTSTKVPKEKVKAKKKANGVSILEKIKKGVSLRAVSQKDKKSDEHAKESSFVNILQRAFLKRRSAFEDEDEDETIEEWGFDDENQDSSAIGCDMCGNHNITIKCPCLTSSYCSADCHKYHWNQSHKQTCCYVR